MMEMCNSVCLYGRMFRLFYVFLGDGFFANVSCPKKFFCDRSLSQLTAYDVRI